MPGTNEKPFFGGFTQNYRIGAMCVVLGGVLLASSRIIATVPDWAYTVLFITAGLTVLVTPAAMWWAYRVGLGKLCKTQRHQTIQSGAQQICSQTIEDRKKSGKSYAFFAKV